MVKCRREACVARTPAQETVFRAVQHRLKGFPGQELDLGNAEDICGKLRTALFWAEALLECWAAAWMEQCGLQQSPRVGKS